ncbi:hypothetical protein G7074_19460 [Pedobacter sp. HDW13]|uniref:tetratricopeptide repeat protein n=1 Tax=Pedobacter sp. HDW13 TaxID=2714940 RepID=UPI001409BBC3|nr:hypothetical protein [Pedobacter sp. HDW13]QIL41250.1 hypothetical protein G7074_19460 [Pedobacter sp. HDW13]
MNISIYFTAIALFSYSFAYGQILDTANLEVHKSVRIKYSDNKVVESLCVEAGELFSMVQYTKGLALFEKADSLENNNSMIKSGIGWAYMHIPDYVKAIENFHLALAINPRDSSSKRNIMICYLYQKKYDIAIMKGKQYLKEYPNDPESYYNLMTVYYYAKDQKNAIRFGKSPFHFILLKKADQFMMPTTYWV